MNKKAQGQIITTILIILLVLAAIVIVWQVVGKTVEEGADSITTQSSCIGIVLDITAAAADTGIVSITRRTGGDEDALSGVTILVNGAVSTHTGTDTLAVLTSGTLTVTTGFDKDDEITVAGILDDGTKCDAIATFTATAS